MSPPIRMAGIVQRLEVNKGECGIFSRSNSEQGKSGTGFSSPFFLALLLFHLGDKVAVANLYLKILFLQSIGRVDHLDFDLPPLVVPGVVRRFESEYVLV